MKHETFPAVTVAANELRGALAFMRQVVERRNTIPILGAIRITGAGDSMTVTGADLDIECSVTLPAEAAAPVSFCINPMILTRLLSGETGRVSISVAGGIITVQAGILTARINDLYPAIDFPPFNFSPSDTADVPEQALVRALRVCLPRISLEETRYYLNGVYLHPVGDTLCAVATDGHQLGRYQTDAPWPLPAMIVPRKTALILRNRIMDRPDSAIRCAADTTASVPRIEFAADNWVIRSKVIDGTFPNYTLVIPAPADDIDVLISVETLRRLAVGMSDMPRAVQIDGDGGMMTAAARSFSATICAPVTGKGPAIGFKHKYLMAMANLGPAFRIQGKGPNDPARLITDDPAATIVLMPMRF